MTEYRNYYFEDAETGEEFFVAVAQDGRPQMEQVESAVKIANKYFDNPKCLGWVSDETADEWGLDTY